MKKMFHIGLLFFVILLLLTGCKKYDNTNHDLSGNNYIGGTAYLYNDYSANGIQTPLTNQLVKISDSTELPPPNFLYTVTTDSNGGFVFPNLRNGIAYTVFAWDTLSGMQFYGAATNTLLNDLTPIPNVVLNLSLDSLHQNGFVYTVTDSSGNVINGCSVWVFSSPLLAGQMDTIPGDSCEGCNFSVVTNGFGKAFQVNLAQATYITLFRDWVGHFTLSGEDSALIIPQFGIVRKTIVIGRH
jgi:hypothetical protein